MAASRSDSYVLGNDVLFQHRIQASLLAACISIQTENFQTTVFHRERSNYVVSILSSMTAFNDAVQRHSFGVATDAAVLSDATVSGTVVLTVANADAQQALATDAHIDAAVSGQFNTFFKTPDV